MSDVEQESGWDRRRSTLLTRYELLAWDLFAKRGYREVTVDDIAESAGVSARTLFRYFPTKEDYLLGMPRRGTQELVELIVALDPSSSPLPAVWELIQSHAVDNPPELRLLKLWRRAAADATEIHARVRGERMHSLSGAVAEYCGRCLGVDLLADPRPRLLAGLVMGLESAAIEMWGRSPIDLESLFVAARSMVPGLEQPVATGMPQD